MTNITLWPLSRTIVNIVSKYARHVILLPCFICVATAGELRLKGSAVQGGLIIGSVTPHSQIRVNRQLTRVSDEGLFLIGFGRNDRGSFEIAARHQDGTISIETLNIDKRKYRVEKIDGLPTNMVTPTKKEQKRINSENRQIAQAREIDTDMTWFQAGFMWPASGRISGVYGSQRILNGETRRPHYGVDIACPEGTSVVSPAPGRVLLAEKDLYYTGGTIIIDHGFGLSSTLSHLSQVNITYNDLIKKGQVVGAVGSTGRSTGPHLDWRVNLFKTRLDPELLSGPMVTQ